MNAPAKIARTKPRVTTEYLVGRRLQEIALAASALYGIANHKGPINHAHQAVVMAHLDELFGWTPIESQQASDMLFEATDNHAIADHDRPRILACAKELTRIAANYHGHDWQDREIWAAGYELFEIDALFDATLTGDPA